MNLYENMIYTLKYISDVSPWDEHIAFVVTTIYCDVVPPAE